MRFTSFLCFFSVAIILFACNNSGSGKNATDSTDATDNLDDSPDSTLVLDPVLKSGISSWLSFLKEGETLSADSFVLKDVWIEDSLMMESYHPDKSFLSLYGPFLKYNRDSTYFVDLDSYNITLKRDKDSSLTGYSGDPDTQVYLVDVANEIRKRLLFLGPGSYIEDAWWINNESVLLAGVFEDESGKQLKPAIWKVNILENLYEVYEYKRDIWVDKILNYSYIDKRLKGVNIR